MTSTAPIEELSFEAALGELETIVRSLETGQAPLEESITAYERGVALRKQCETRLREAREKIEKLTIQKDGSITAQPLDKE